RPRPGADEGAGGVALPRRRIVRRRRPPTVRRPGRRRQGVRRGPAVGPRPQERAELLTKGPAMSDTETIVSGDVRREQRIPPGQVLTRKWPVLHAGVAPPFDPATWDFRVDGLVKQPRTFTFDEFRSLSRVTVRADMHCVTRWSKLDNVWEGVP